MILIILDYLDLLNFSLAINKNISSIFTIIS